MALFLTIVAICARGPLSYLRVFVSVDQKEKVPRTLVDTLDFELISLPGSGVV